MIIMRKTARYAGKIFFERATEANYGPAEKVRIMGIEIAGGREPLINIKIVNRFAAGQIPGRPGMGRRIDSPEPAAVFWTDTGVAKSPYVQDSTWKGRAILKS